MQVRNAIVAVTVAAFALTLSACSSDPVATTTQGEPTAPATTASGSPTTEPTGNVTIRPIQEGYHLDNVSDTIRGGFPSYADKTDDEIATILNAGCDAMDAKGAPQAGADAMQAFGISAADAAFTLSASISLYCPEYAAFLNGSTTTASPSPSA